MEGHKFMLIDITEICISSIIKVCKCFFCLIPPPPVSHRSHCCLITECLLRAIVKPFGLTYTHIKITHTQ